MPVKLSIWSTLRKYFCKGNVSSPQLRMGHLSITPLSENAGHLIHYPSIGGWGSIYFFPELFHFTFSSICNSTACFIPSKHFIPSEHFIPFSIFVKIQCPSSEMNRGFVHQCLTPYPSCSKTATEQCSLTFSQFGRTFTEHSSLAYSHCSKTFTDHCFLTFSQCRKI